MFRSLSLSIFASAWLLVLCGCGHETTKPIDISVFGSSDYPLVLAFDLREDAQPVAGLVFKGTNINYGIQTISLPFGSDLPVLGSEYFPTWGSYDEMTIIRTAISTPNFQPFVVSFRPRFGREQKWSLRAEDLPDSLYLLRDGLHRRFIFRYSDSATARTQRSALQSNENLSAVAVALPLDAKQSEIRHGQTEIPARIFEAKQIAFYPGSAQLAKEPILEVAYVLKTSPSQELAQELGVKLVLLLIPAIGGLVFIPRKQDTERNKRRIALIILGCIQGGLILWLGFSATKSGSTGAKQIGDLALVACGIVLAILVPWLKREKGDDV